MGETITGETRTDKASILEDFRGFDNCAKSETNHS